VTRPTPFDKMRTNRRRRGSRESELQRLLNRINEIEREEAATWETQHRCDEFHELRGARRPPARRRLFGWLLAEN
jgi:hypothetical protein